MAQETRTLSFPVSDASRIDDLRTALVLEGFRIRALQHAALAMVRADAAVTLYNTGRLVIQGQAVGPLIEIVQMISGVPPDSEPLSPMPTSPSIRGDGPWIGTDESGKGDYFGPLVIAGVRLDSTSSSGIAALGVRDSKKLSDTAINRIAPEIRRQVPHAVVVIGPEKYNQLHEQMKSVNSLLAWGHARCIENILETSDAVVAVADQFGDEKYIQSALMHRGKQIRLEQRTHAETDLAVAAASILARHEFVIRLQRLGLEIGIELPKGAGPEVDSVARRVATEKGTSMLRRIAKVHFRTTSKIAI